ncbi:MAG: twin-arginine translocation pathway signal protein [Paracoccaceae bacterium]|nr:twin-arginine translocation pathway signal protein [Paracoccaceae bacterium]
MPLSRRRTLALIGGGTIFAASTSAATFLSTRTPKDALSPWSAAGEYDDPRLNALSFALLAPNPHNLQPWSVALEGDDTVLLYQDTARRLPHTDPFDRQITIGLGCFLEQMMLAAGAQGFNVDLELFPKEEQGAVARAVFGSGGAADPLFDYVMERRSCKEPFEPTPLKAAHANELELFADVYTDETTVNALKKLTWDAWAVEANTERTNQESVDLMRFGKAEINENPDGIDLGGPFLETLMLAGVLNRTVLSDPQSNGSKQGAQIYAEMLNATPAYAALVSEGNERSDQIKVGRQWLRLNLKCTALGVALHPVSQCLQEFPEMAGHYAHAHKILAPSGQTVQMLGRLGYGPTTPRTPRWPLEAKLMNV